MVRVARFTSLATAFCPPYLKRMRPWEGDVTCGKFVQCKMIQ